MATVQEAAYMLNSFRVTGPGFGAPSVVVSFNIHPNHCTLSGTATVKKSSTNPPFVMKSLISGFYLTLMFRGEPQTSYHITGVDGYTWPANAGIGPIRLPNLHMVINEAQGTASYSYRDANGEWSTVNDAKAERLLTA